MVITVNTRFLLKDYPEGYGNFIYETFTRLAGQHPEHSFNLIFERPYAQQYMGSGYNLTVLAGALTKNPLSRWWWNKFLLPKILKKYKSDVFVETHELQNKFYWVNEKFAPLHFEEREQIKDKYAGGNEYFLCAGSMLSEKNLVNLLKAFSLFKKRQKTGMQLLIAGSKGWKNEEFSEALRLFKFRGEVKILENLTVEDLAKITAAAYAIVYPFSLDGYNVPPLEAMRAGVPALTSNIPAMHEICGDAALYFDPSDAADISQKMMMIYKDEEFRRTMIEKGNEQAKKYDWEKAAEELCNLIEKTATIPGLHPSVPASSRAFFKFLITFIA